VVMFVNQTLASLYMIFDCPLRVFPSLCSDIYLVGEKNEPTQDKT